MALILRATSSLPLLSSEGSDVAFLKCILGGGVAGFSGLPGGLGWLPFLLLTNLVGGFGADATEGEGTNVLNFSISKSKSSDVLGAGAESTGGGAGVVFKGTTADGRTGGGDGEEDGDNEEATVDVLRSDGAREGGGDLNFGCCHGPLSNVNKLGCDLEDINGGFPLILDFCLGYNGPTWRSVTTGKLLERSGDLGASVLSFESNPGEDLDLLSIRGLGSEFLQLEEEEDCRACECNEEGEMCVRWW